MDFVGCNPALINDGQFIYKFLSELPIKMGMNKIGNPHLDLYSGPHPEWDGWSATIHIQTSHITGHFFAFGYAFLDIFSCRDFAFDKVFEMVKTELEADQHKAILDKLKPEHIKAMEYLESQKSNYRLIKRGLNFPPSLAD